MYVSPLQSCLIEEESMFDSQWVLDTTIIDSALITSFLLIQFPNRTSTKLSILAPSSLSQINILGEQLWSYHSFLKVWVPTAHELKYKLHSSSFEFFNDLKFTYFPFISLSHTRRPIKQILTSHTQILYSFCFPQIIFRSWYYFISNSTSPNPLNSVLKASFSKSFWHSHQNHILSFFWMVLWTKCLCRLKIHMLSPNPQRDCTQGEGLWEGGKS